MVFLRLTVKIYPPEQIQASSSFSLRSILSSDDAVRNPSGVPAGKPASFLLVLENPEDVTLGGLAKMIQEKWTKLRPNVEPLQIKKMLDDDHDTDDLDVDMTAADVFVDRGLAHIDARDQRGILRVIQKPTPYSPARFPSVTLDWDAAAEDYERRIQDKREAAANSVHKFPTIPEEDSQAGSVSGSQDDDRQHTPTPTTPAHQTDELERRRDMPVLSVEKEHEIPGSPARWDEQPHVQEQDSQDNNEKTIEATPQHRRFESQELGGSPTPMRPSVPLSEKTAAASQPRAPASRGRAANRTINKVATESKSPPPGKGQHLAEQTPPVHRKTRSLTRRRIPQLMKPVEDDEDEGEANEQNNGIQKEEGGEKDNGDNGGEESFDGDGDVAMDDGGDTFTSATEEAPEQDLGNGDAPETRQTRLGKRKKSQEDLQSNKEPRLDRAGTPTQETPEPRSSTPSAMQKRKSAPSFSGPGHRPSITEQHPPPRSGLGLGITKSPPRKQPTKPDFSNSSTKGAKLVFVDSAKNREQPSSQTTVTAAPVSFNSARKSLTQNDSTPAKPQTPADKVRSALRKEASTDKHRFVSFSKKNSVFSVTDDSQSRSPSGPAAKEPEKARDRREKSSKDKAWQEKPPTAGVTVYPGGVTAEKLQRIFEEQQREAEKKKQEQEEMDREMREAEERNASPEYLELLAEIQRTRAYISENKNSGRQKTQKQVTSYRVKLDAQLQELEYLKTNPNGHSKTPEKRRKKKKSASQVAAEKSEEINTPESTSKDSAKRTNAARRESSSKRSPAKSPPKETESEEAAPTETTNGDSAQTTEAEASQEPETAPAETPSQSKRKASPADKAQNKEPVTRRSRSLRAVDGADVMDIDQPEPLPERQQEKEQDKEPEREQEGEQGQGQPEDPEPEPEPQPQDEEEDGDETEEEQEQGQEKEQMEAQQEPEPEAEPEPEQQFEPGQHEPEKELKPEQEPAQEREPEQEQQPEPEPEVEQEAEPQSEQQPQKPEEPEEQPQEPEMVPETSQPQPQEPQEPQQAKSEQPEQPEQQSPQKPQSQPSRLLSQEQSQNFPMSDDVNLPEMETIRTLDQSKKPEEQPAPQPTPEEPKPASPEQGNDKESSSEDDDETDSETGSGSDSDSDSDSGSGSGSDDDEEQGPELTKADLLRRANGANGTSSARNSMTKFPASSQQQLPQSQPLPQNRYSSPRGSSQPPAQSQPQPHIQPFQSVNKLSSARASLQGLRNVITAQKQNYDAQLQEARMATVTRRKDVFDPPSDSESEDDSESDSDSDSDSDSGNETGAEDGDIQSSGTVGKLRKALQKK